MIASTLSASWVSGIKRAFMGDGLVTIRCSYSCRGCGLVDAAVDVPARTSEDVAIWLEKICAQSVANDHVQRSPLCQSRVCDLKIPITGSLAIHGNAYAMPIFHC